MSDVLAIALSQMENYRAMKFEQKLQAQLDVLNVEEAETLCIDIHEAEIDGYVLSEQEERLWLKLTDKLQHHWTDNVSTENNPQTGEA